MPPELKRTNELAHDITVALNKALAASEGNAAVFMTATVWAVASALAALSRPEMLHEAAAMFGRQLDGFLLAYEAGVREVSPEAFRAAEVV